MARPLRLDLPNCFYHVLNRGVERRVIYEDRADNEKFLELLGLMSEKYAIGIWSYVLMGNHFHLLLKPDGSNLSKAMQWLGLTYSGYFNHRHRRSGCLFQSRFKSFVVEEGDYLERLICYMHRNPLRAGIVERLAEYLWSSYPCLGYGRHCRSWLLVEEVLRLFGGERNEFRKAVQSYSEEESSVLEDLKHGILLGGEQMAAWLRETLDGQPDRERPQVRKLLTTKSIDDLVSEIAAVANLTSDEVEALRMPARRRPRPMRDMLIYLVWRNSAHSMQTVGDYFGLASTTLPAARMRGESALRKNRKLRAALKNRFLI